jgi:phosphoglucosamine mutase
MPPPRLFGTDGIRGPFGEPPLDPDTVRRIGMALGKTLATTAPEPMVLLGGDTRSSTPQICRWLAQGLVAAGCRYRYSGTLPTPAIARSVVDFGAAAGVAVSASHNPYPDNGIKLIDGQGFKWTQGAERRLEETLSGIPELSSPTPLDLTIDQKVAETYLDHLTAVLPEVESLRGCKIVLDTAHGAATGLAPRLFERLGATVTTLGDRPDGTNINSGCGSTRPEALAAATVTNGGGLGFAFDGDADRVLAADQKGTVHSGDATLYLLARWLKSRGDLDPPTIVATSMSNLGLEVALGREGIQLLRCDVGDRVVVDTLRREGLLLGGEQSGHIVHLGLATTGDGLLTALLLANLTCRTGKSLSELLEGFRNFPQILRNVRVSSMPDLNTIPSVRKAVRETESALGTRGRLVLRYSGTEPLARVMIEGADRPQVESLAAHLAEVIASSIGEEE